MQSQQTEKVFRYSEGLVLPDPDPSLGIANWTHVGKTAGRGRMDRKHKAHGQAVKDIYIYPLVSDARQRLCRDLTR